MHKYTIVTVNGNINLTTPTHHDEHDSIEEWIKAHKNTIATALGIASFLVQVSNVYIGHNKSGALIK